MKNRAAIVTGGLRGLGKAMTFGLAKAGYPVLAVGHLAEDVPIFLKEADTGGIANRAKPLVADIRKPEECDRVIATALESFGSADILVNSAGLTFTYIWPDKYRRTEPMKFWQTSDEVVQNVMDTNFVAASQMASRIAPLCVEKGWGRIVNVTTKLTTMNQIGAMPYGASKAALELATEVWAREAEGTGLTINIVNPGAGANTPGIAEEMRRWSAEGSKPRLVEPDDMVAPLLWVVSEAANDINGWRYDANTWDASVPPEEAHRSHGAKAGIRLHPGAQ
jgi:3-oxoacyl-[acyl-carrier protein] reductase